MTVAQAIAHCIQQGHPDTSLVAGLDRCVLAEVVLEAPGSLIPVQSPLVKPASPNVHLYLQPVAAHGLADVAAGRGTTLTVISGWRGPVGQLMLWKCFEAHAGVPLAARPGFSNHEQAGAVDVEDPHGWEAFFVRRGWRWLGSRGDPAHFDLSGAGMRGDLATKGVRALQRLLVAHGAQLSADGSFGAATENACLAAPAGGWTTASVGGNK